MSTPEHHHPSAKAQRVLACILCQQRKVKCDRKFPCANCVKAQAQCVPATQVKRQRRPKFSERELVERLRRYEELLRQHNIDFEPLLGNKNRDPSSPDDMLSEAQGAGQGDPSNVKIKAEPTFEAKSIWHAMHPSGDDDDDDDNEYDSISRFENDDLREYTIKRAMDQWFGSSDHLLFGSQPTAIDLSTLHPDQAQIFRLWQVYLETVDPLLKVTHSPTLQARIVNAASDLKNIDPALEALMFSIYCIASLSLAEEQSSTSFGSTMRSETPGDLWKTYQFGCHQALLNCGVLRSGNRDCLTALYFYIISIRGDTDPRSVSCLFSVAIHIAQRMGIHSESTNSKYSALEAEMRRRLWWSLVNSGQRVAEMSDYKTTILMPNWDCKIPLNVNDSDILAEMKVPPVNNQRPTEAIFAVVRSDVSEALRHSTFHLDFTNPSLKAIAKDTPHSDLNALEKTIESSYLQFCNPENPLHQMTILSTRAYCAKLRLLEHYSRPLGEQTSAQRDSAIYDAMTMLECDSQVLSSPLTRRYRWFTNWYFPFTSYMYMAQDMKKRPMEGHAERAWTLLSDNHEIRFSSMVHDDNPFHLMHCRLIMQAWESREALLKQSDKHVELPRIITAIRQLMQRRSNAQNNHAGQPSGVRELTLDDFSIPISMDFGGNGMSYGMLWQGSAAPSPGNYMGIPGQGTMDVNMSQLADWTTLDWDSMHL